MHMGWTNQKVQLKNLHEGVFFFSYENPSCGLDSCRNNFRKKKKKPIELEFDYTFLCNRSQARMLFLQLNQKKNYEEPNSSQCSGSTFGTKIWYWWLMAMKNLGYSWPRRPSSRSTAQFCIAELELNLFPYENRRCNSDFGKNSSRKRKKVGWAWAQLHTQFYFF